MKKTLILIVSILFIILVACDSGNSGEEDEGSIDNVSMATYEVESSGYADVSAVADKLSEDYDMKIDLLPSGTGVGRMSMMNSGKTQFGKLGDEYQFNYRAIEEYAAKDKGPEPDLRVVWGIMTNIGGAVMEDSDIEDPEDLEGKKVPYIEGNSSINIKTNSLLAMGDLTWDDVEQVQLSSYGDQAEALSQGKIDVASMIPGASALVEVDELEGVKWVQLPDSSDEEAWEAGREHTPWIVPNEWTEGAGISEDNPELFMSYPYPIVTREDTDPEIVKELVTRIADSYEGYKDSTSETSTWGKEEVSTTPLGVPYHEGAIEYFEENDMWDDDKAEENEKLKENGKEIEEEWNEIIEKAEEEGIADDEFPEYWQEEREEISE